MRMKNYEIRQIILETMNLFNITPNEILMNFSLREFQIILSEQPYSVALSLRLKAMEIYFNTVEAYEHSGIIYTYLQKNRI
jgi:hypothetical protein